MSIKQHLISRHVDLDVHRPIIDEENRVATFYLWNLSGVLVGYQQYRPDAGKMKHNNPKEGRYFTLRKQPTVAVFGLESFYFRSDILFVVEGAFDAARIIQQGYPAVAMLGNDPDWSTRNWLTLINRKIIAVCDSGNAGKKLAKLGDDVVTCDDGHDVSSSSDNFVNKLLKKYE